MPLWLIQTTFIEILKRMKNEKIVFITHSALADPGEVGQALRMIGYKTDICCPLLGDSLPELYKGKLKEYAASVVFGGPMFVSDADEMDFLNDEITWVSEELQNNAPILGICLGAQIIAHCLGAKVWTHPEDVREIGYHEVYATCTGNHLFPESLKVYHWHREGFDLPDGAHLLATGGKAFYNQAFQYGENAYAVQFHPEMNLPTMERWITSELGAPQLSLSGAQPAELQRAEAPDNNRRMRIWLNNFLDIWLKPLKD